tara:strand:- start:91 stop:297 length:207 start_codon:yes stop_codon:yes gene_type:complete
MSEKKYYNIYHDEYGFHESLNTMKEAEEEIAEMILHQGWKKDECSIEYEIGVPLQSSASDFVNMREVE